MSQPVLIDPASPATIVLLWCRFHLSLHSMRQRLLELSLPGLEVVEVVWS